MRGSEISEGTIGAVTNTPIDDKNASIPKENRGTVKPSKWRATVRVRLRSGEVKQIERYRRTKAAANNAVKEAARDLLDKEGKQIVSETTVAQLAKKWVGTVEESTRYAARTKRAYVGTVDRFLSTDQPLIKKPIASIRPGHLDDLLESVAKEHGNGSAKTLRTVLVGIFSLAVRHGHCEYNAARQTAHWRVRVKDSRPVRDHSRAFTPEEVQRLLKASKEPQHGRNGSDVADLVELLLHTALRIGESTALHWKEDIKLQDPSLSVASTVSRVTGEGLIRPPRTKTLNSKRTLWLSDRAVELLKDRRKAMPNTKIVFEAKQGGYRDPSNVNKQIRRLLDQAGLEWAVPHTFRRTVITWLGDLGIPLRQIADFAGHADPSETVRSYLGRRGPSDELVNALQGIDSIWKNI